MERITRFRAGIILTVFLAIVGFFVLKLHQLQIVETGGETDNTTYYYSYVTIKAARGDILDSNGNAMVSNRASYNLMFNHYIINSAENTNQHLLDLIDLCRELEIKYVDHFPITKVRPYEYTLSEYSSSWRSYFQAYLANKGIDSDITAPLLMQKLRSFYNIPTE